MQKMCRHELNHLKALRKMALQLQLEQQAQKMEDEALKRLLKKLR